MEFAIYDFSICDCIWGFSHLVILQRKSRHGRVSVKCVKGGRLPPAAAAGGSRSCATIASVGGGRNKCDPPACISGRRGLRPSRVHLRSQRTATLPYTSSVAEELRPSRATHDGEAHPSCDRLRGSLRSGDMSPLSTAHYPHSKTGNRRIKNNVPPLLISTPGCCTIRAIFEQRRGFGHGVRA